MRRREKKGEMNTKKESWDEMMADEEREKVRVQKGSSDIVHEREVGKKGEGIPKLKLKMQPRPMWGIRHGDIK